MTPNSDGVNDALVIGYSNENNSNELIIFDEQGNEVYSEEGYKNNWKGMSSDGTDLPVGVYYFNYREVGEEGAQDRSLKSFFHIVR